MRLVVVGTGYVGLVAGICFAETGNAVLGLDIDTAKTARLQRGELPIYEPGLAELLERNVREGRLNFTTDYGQAAAHARVFFLCLPTPPAEDGSADTRYVLAAVRELALRLAPLPAAVDEAGPPLFVLKSTVPPGTHRHVRQEIAARYARPFSVAANPEFLKEGTALDDFLKPDRVVLGVEEDRAFEVLRALHEPFCRTGAPILRMDPLSAALAKYAANCFLAVKISFMNELARLCDACGADIEWVRRGMSLDARIGKAFLFPGVGYGGSCFPKDTRALAAMGQSLSTPLAIVEAAERANEAQKTILAPKILAHLGPVPRGQRVAFWGLAFKPRTDDIREAPALALIEVLLQAGVEIAAYDPEALATTQRVLGARITYAANAYAALEGAAALVLVTEWNEFRSPDWARVKSLLRRPAIFDGRNLYDPARLRDLGFEYWGIGRGIQPPTYLA